MPSVTIDPVVDSLDTVPETLRASYEEREGKFVLTKPVQFDDAAEVKGALAKERAAAADAKRQAKELEARLAAFEVEKAAQGAGMTADKLREIEAQIRARIVAEYEPQVARATEIEARAKKNALKAALAAHVVDTDAAVTLLADHFEFTDDGIPHPKGDTPDGMAAYLTKLRAEKGWLFKGTEAAGGGATGGGSAPVTGAPGSRPVREWSSAEKMAYAQAHGREALDKLAAADGRKLAAAALKVA